jgi:uncharacterized protein (TIGR03435 family)
MRMMNAALAVSLLFAATHVLGQSSNPSPSSAPGETKPLAFDVVSIRPSTRTDGAWGFPHTPDGFSAMSVPLRKLIEEAYSRDDDNLVVGGPSWIDSANFDIQAKLAPGDADAAQKLPQSQRSAMLQPVLIDRFHLIVHHETRQVPVFFLTISKQGAHLKVQPPATKNSGCMFHMPNIHTLSAENCAVGSLIQVLRNPAGRIVLDRTGLIGIYDFSLHWTPDNTPVDSPTAGGPSIFTAVQEQLGLRLEPASAPLDVLVIDSAQKPSPN